MNIKKFLISAIVGLVLSSLIAQSKTIKDDVTDDHLNDKIEMGLKSVVVTDFVSCCTRRKYTVVSDVENLADIMVADFHHGVKGKEIAVITLPDRDYITEIYALRNKQFVSVSELLPGTVSFDDRKNLFGYRTHTWQGGDVQVPWPIIEDAGFLKPAFLAQEIETIIVIEASETKEIKIDMIKNTLAVVVAAAQEKDAIIFLLDSDGTLITQRTIDSELPLSGKSFADEDKTISLVIDNLQSTTLKTIYYVIKHYVNAVMEGK